METAPAARPRGAKESSKPDIALTSVEVTVNDEVGVSPNDPDEDTARQRTQAEEIAFEEELAAEVIRQEVAQRILGQDRVVAEEGVINFNK